MPGACSEAAAPYRFDCNKGSDTFGTCVNGHTLPMNLTLQPEHSRDLRMDWCGAGWRCVAR